MMQPMTRISSRKLRAAFIRALLGGVSRVVAMMLLVMAKIIVFNREAYCSVRLTLLLRELRF